MAVAWPVHITKTNLQRINSPLSTYPTAKQTAKKDAESLTAQYTLDAIAAWNIFGTPVSKMAEPDLSALPETALSLTLHGTFTSSSENFSSILVSVENNQAKRVYEHDEISPGVLLHWVGDRDVIILRGTLLETLLLYEPTVHTKLPRRHTPADTSNFFNAITVTTTND